MKVSAFIPQAPKKQEKVFFYNQEQKMAKISFQYQVQLCFTNETELYLYEPSPSYFWFLH